MECEDPSFPGSTRIRYGPVGLSFPVQRSLEQQKAAERLELKVEGLTNQSDERVGWLVADSRSIQLLSQNRRLLILALKICDKLLLDPSNQDAHLIELFFEDKGSPA